MKRVLLLSLCLTGCVGGDFYLKKQVSFDEKCPAENIRVVEWGPDNLSADLLACGKPLTYHNSPVMYEHTGVQNWTRALVK